MNTAPAPPSAWGSFHSSGCRRSTSRSCTSCSTGWCSPPRGTSSPATRATSPSAMPRSSAPASTPPLCSPASSAGRSSPRCPRRRGARAPRRGARRDHLPGARAARRALRAAHPCRDLRRLDDRAQHAGRRRAGRVSRRGVSIPKLAPTPSGTFYLLSLALAFASVWIAYAVYHSRFGTGLFAIHDDEEVAEVMGVPTYRFKLAAFALSCALAGVAGGIYALFVSYVTVGETFSGWIALYVILMAALGGTRHWLGPALGAAALTTLLYVFTTSDYAVAGRAALGLIFILVILFLPQGLLGRFAHRRALPKQNRVAAPSEKNRGLTPSSRSDSRSARRLEGVQRRPGACQGRARGAARRDPGPGRPERLRNRRSSTW